ncbi:SRPBCC family protein [Nocardia africana]|uniref:Predicted integral membrane protein n=1 Tax=Nocardia africana TaxID=134964 RepID=A0A378X498_9NOCA|nr:SRPBCC family protein [Nocardia africana]MCC3317109.1 SRPBCC family protein [Nocardia africana]SUA47837.1 Predicted integral membrane protein [Nocardia africana]
MAKTAQPVGPLQQSVQNLAGTLAERAVEGLSNRVSKTAGRLNDYAGGEGNLIAAVTGIDKLAGGGSPLQAVMSGGMSKLKHSAGQTFESLKNSLTGGRGKGGGGKKLKLTNIVEEIDVGVPIDLAYDQWTQFADFPKFTKKLEQVEQVSDEKLSWTGKVFWSRRTWESTIIEQVPFERIIWRSKGAKGYIDGAVGFYELTPNLTRILVVLEYHPQGVIEKTGNLWRAAGRRCRLELKHFQRHVMTDAVLHGDDIVGWHGEIRDGKVVEDDETARQREEEENAEEDHEEGNAEEDSADEEAFDDEEPDETEDEDDEHDEDQRDSDEEEEPEPPRRRTAARKSSVTRRPRVSGGVGR